MKTASVIACLTDLGSSLLGPRSVGMSIDLSAGGMSALLYNSKSNQIKSNQIKLNLFNDGTLSNTSCVFALPGAVYVYARIFVGKCPHFLVLSKSLSRRAFLKRFGSLMV